MSGEGRCHYVACSELATKPPIGTSDPVPLCTAHRMIVRPVFDGTSVDAGRLVVDSGFDSDDHTTMYVRQRQPGEI